MSFNNWMFVLLINIFGIHGSHFDGGFISYEIVGNNGSKVIVRITQSYTYDYSKIYCNDTYIANQWNLVLSPYGDATATLNYNANWASLLVNELMILLLIMDRTLLSLIKELLSVRSIYQVVGIISRLKYINFDRFTYAT